MAEGKWRVPNIYTTSVIVLSLSALIENLAYGLPLSYFPNYAITLGSPIAYIGFFTAASMTTSALLSSKFGHLSDRIGRKKLIQVGLIADVFLGTLTGLISHWFFLLIIRALNGVATAAVRTPAEASLIDQVSEKRRGEAISFYMTISMIGWFLGPVFGGSIQHVSKNVFGLSLENSYRIPFFVDSLLAAIALGLVAWKVGETRGLVVVNQKNSLRENEEIVLSPKLSFSLKILYVVSLTTGFAVGFIQPIVVLFLSDFFEASPLQIGIILTISGSVGIFCNFFAGRAADRIGRKPVIAFGTISSRAADIVFPFSSDLTVATGLMSFRSLGINVSMPASHALRADIIPAKIRGKLLGRIVAFFDIGMIIGPILATWLYDIYRYEVFTLTTPVKIYAKGAGLPFYISGILGLTALALLLAFVEEPKRHRKETLE